MLELILYYGAMSFSTWVAVTGWFFAYGKAVELHDKGVSFPWHIKAAIYIYLATGLVFDVLWNWLIGSFIFLEIPRELLFTSRVKRHVRGVGWRQHKAQKWARIMNKIDPGHV